MSSINAATAAAPWLKNKRARFFEPTGPSVTSYAPPTGDPLDTFHGLYAGTPLTATAPAQASGGGAPTILEVIGSFSGTIGSTNALPTFGVTYANEATSITYTIYAGPTWPPTAPVASGSVPVANPFSVQYTGATVNGYYYKGTFTVTNASGSDVGSNSSPLLNLVAPSVTVTSASFAGTVGTTNALPSCAFTVGGTVTDLTYTLYGDASATPSSVVSTGPLSTSATTFEYSGATVLGYNYQFQITASNAAGSTSSSSSILQNLVPPTVTITSFTFAGTLGSTNALPTCVFAPSGIVTDISFTIYGDTSAFPSTVVAAGALGASATSYQYTGATVASYYYKVTITVSNSTGPNSATTTTLVNAPAPTVSVISASFTSPGTTNAEPTVAFLTSGLITNLNYTLYGDTSPTPTTVVSTGSIAPSLTVYPYTGPTVVGYYYSWTLTASNTSGSSSSSSPVILNLAAPTVVITSIAFAGGAGSTVAIPSCYFTPSGTVTSITYTLYGDTSPTPTTVVSTGPVTPSATFYQYLGATVNGYYYKYTITVTNVAGSNSATSSVLRNVVPWFPTSPASKLVAWFDGTRGVTTTSWTNYANSSLTQGNMIPYVSRPFALTTVNGLQAVTVQYTSNGVEQPTFTANYVNKGRSLFYVYKMSAPLSASQTNAIGTTLTSLGGLAFNNNPRFSTATSVNQQIVANPSTVINFTTNLTSTNNQSSYPTCYGVYSSAVTATDGVFCMNNTKYTPSVNLVVPATVLNTVTYRLRMGGATATPWTYCEILMYDGELTSSDITSICDYLVTRWGCGAAP